MQGKNKNEVEYIVDELLKEENFNSGKELFIVYGHDQVAREQLEFILDKINICSKKVTNNTGKTIIEALEHEISLINAGIVLLTPDDRAISNKLFEDSAQNFKDKCHFQARQNVILELGMLISKLGREKTIILSKENVTIPSDLEGVFRLQFENHIKEILPKLVERLKSIGFEIDIDKALKILGD